MKETLNRSQTIDCNNLHLIDELNIFAHELDLQDNPRWAGVLSDGSVTSLKYKRPGKPCNPWTGSGFTDLKTALVNMCEQIMRGAEFYGLMFIDDGDFGLLKTLNASGIIELIDPERGRRNGDYTPQAKEA